jgi:casein kinase II subunit beta
VTLRTKILGHFTFENLGQASPRGQGQEDSKGGKKDLRPDARGAGEEAQEEEASEEEEEEQGEEEEEEESSEIDEVSWIQWFCSLQGNEFFTEVAEDFVQDDFNLTGLGTQVAYYDYALDIILDIETPQDEMLTDEQQEIVESAAEVSLSFVPLNPACPCDRVSKANTLYREHII